jgi:UDP-N-acetylmuramoyl-L-alanyl-D-glutamate--2,6-diaminopimelate ligase
MLTRLPSPDAAARWLRAGVTGSLRTDSRRVRPGDGFIAWPGHAVDGRRFVAEALEAGAASVLVEDQGVEVYGFADARVGTLARLKAATGLIADAYFDHPSEQLSVVATTGTNGKTSTAWWTAQALTLLGRRCGLVGTLGVGEPPRVGGGEEAMGPGVNQGQDPHGRPHGQAYEGGLEFTGLTTPDPVTLQASLRCMADAGFTACAIEASSIGLVEHRLAATRINVALFTNFTRDHLDFHGGMAEYWAAKRALFDWPGLEAAVINLDDPQGAALAADLAASANTAAEQEASSKTATQWAVPATAVAGSTPRTQSASAGAPRSGADPGLSLWTFSLHDRSARLCAGALGHVEGGLAFRVHEGAQSVDVRSCLIGDFNAANLLAVIGALRALGIPLGDAARAASQLTPVPGRLQRVGLRDNDRGGDPAGVSSGAFSGTISAAPPAEAPPGPELVVDYAHTPDALEKVLAALRGLARARGGRLVCVFGCGGNRDASKRPLMAAAAERLADAVVVTSDNPRHENPEAILADILAGFTRPEVVQVTPDRRRAITEAVLAADARDLLLIAGKGHESYQEVAGQRQPFSDVDEARRALALRTEIRQAQAAGTLGPGAVAVEARSPVAGSGAAS